MAQIENIITTTFKARGSQAIAEMGGIARGAQGMGRSIYEASRMSERFGQQWRAIGTTIRYALAGGVIFGLRGMVDQLKNVQTQLGLIAAIGSQPGGGILGTPFSSAQVSKLGFQLQKTAVDSITPINDINDATVNFLSTVQNADPGQIPNIMRTIAQGATLAQTPVSDLTQAVTSMNNAFGRPNNAANISQVVRQWYALISLAPGGIAAAPQIATQLGPLSQVALLGRSPNVSGGRAQSQLFSLVLGSLRFGGSPSTNLRGLQYFLQSLSQPTSSGGRAILQGMGITPQYVHDKGIYSAAIKFLRGITNTGNIGAIKGMSEDQLAELDTSGGSLPGIPPQEMLRLRTALGRVHAVRAAVTLAYQLRQRGGIASLQQDLNTMEQAQQDQVQGAANMAQAWQRFRARTKLQQAAVAINVMALQVAQIFEPVLNFAANRITGLSGVLHRHPSTTGRVALGVGAGLAGIGLLRFMGAGRLLGGLSGVKAAQSLATGGGGKTVMDGLGNNPANPLYVIVVSQLFGGGGRGGAGGLGKDVGDAAKIGGWAALMSRMGTAARLTPWAAAAADLGIISYDVHKKGARVLNPFDDRNFGHRKSLAHLGGWTDLARGFVHPMWYLNPPSQRQQHMDVIEKILNTWSPRRHADVTQLFKSSLTQQNGRMYATFDINLKYPDGQTHRKRVHIPVDIWSGGRAPSSRAQPGNSRSR